MKETLSDLLQRYSALLREYLAKPDEMALLQAYELGRRAVSDGLGVLDIVGTHNEALATLLAGAPKQEESWRLVKAAGAFLVESLSPFEMIHRGFREANARLGQLNEALEHYARDLEKSERLLASAQQIAHLGSWEWELPANHLTWSAELYYIHGLQPHQFSVTYDAFLDRVHAGDRESVRVAVENSLKSKAPFSLDYRIVRADGEVRVLHGQGEVLVDGRGEILKMTATAQDITERKEAEETVRSLLQIAETLNSTLDVDRLLDALVQEAIQLTNAEGGCAGLRTPDGIECGKYFRKSEVLPLDRDWAANRALAGWVMRQKVPYVTNNALSGSQVADEFFRSLGVRSAVLTPILDSQGEVIGFFEIHNKRDDSGFSRSDQQKLTALAQVASVAIQNALAYRKVQQAETSLRQLSSRLLKLQDDERRRMALDLHDITGQNLTALGLNLSILRNSTGRMSSKAARALSESLALLEQCLREIRTFSYLLHPPLLDELGLAAALRWYGDGFAKRSGIRIQLDVPSRLRRLPQEVETTLFRIMQESLTNIHRHSGSPSADIRLALDKDEVVLEVRDKGRGIPRGCLREYSENLPGLGVGISGMRERARQIGGRLEIDSSPAGTMVRAVLPFKSTEMGRAGA